jgi:ATP-binding protein involved in chromosome partitioning
LDVPILGIVENMSYLELPDGTRIDVFGEGGGKKLADESSVPFIGSIPMDSRVRVGGDDGRPVVLSHPDSPVAKALITVAEDIAAKISVAALKSNNFVPINMIG